MNRRVSPFIKTLSIAAAAIGFVSMSASAQSKMSVGAGFDLMFPVGKFATHWSTGFGGTGEFD